MDSQSFVLSLVCGGCAGTFTDLTFFPIDTLKTRLQAKGGFFQNGGWKGIYNGLGSCVVASAPSAALFFVTYDAMKRLNKRNGLSDTPNHMFSASCGEIMACLVRVPAEVVKQRSQAGIMGTRSSLAHLKYLLSNKGGEGVIRGLYRGWNTTIMREIPFTIIQFPLYERLKLEWAKRDNGNLSPLKGAVCGSIAGGIAAALTTPLDFIKTRIMLSKSKVSVVTLIKTAYKEEGLSVFWRGVYPRTCWISAGGAIFLGCYETTHSFLSSNYLSNRL